MKANELRIGNWVNLYSGQDAQVTGLTNNGRVWCVNNPHYPECAWNTERINPIPLTEEWLLKFGFGRGAIDMYHAYWHKRVGHYDFCISIAPTGNFYFCLGNEQNSSFAPKQYVHQLQNLYFALTGKELILNENKK